MIRVVAAIVLTILPFFMVRYAGIELREHGNGADFPVVEKTAGGNDASVLQAPLVMYPKAPEMLPDLYTGYLFIEDRVLEDSDFDEFAKGGTEEVAAVSSESLDDVEYQGSLFVGDNRVALIAFSAEKAADMKNRATSAKKSSPKNIQFRQLYPDSRFKGFVVELIEADRIVFGRDGQSFEKFLHDTEKNREIVTSVTATPQPQAMPSTPQQPIAVPVQPPSPPPAQRRSQRLLRRDPSFMVPMPPAPTGKR
ncbi:MAG: hypothetical protein KJ950_14280 [Proteobacteria bacterium]|nr:hypothetical protein [Pseudomonadota bacterium]MBU1685934.1 hypothetical protein [Pseudomonadota bacterium]